jgi:hypothetical protein
MSGKTVFFFNLLWKSNTIDLTLLLISLFLSNQDIKLFIVSRLDTDSFMNLSVISILVSSAKCVNLRDALLLILVLTSLLYRV